MKFNVGDKITPIPQPVTVTRVDNTTSIQWIMVSGDRSHWHRADEFELVFAPTRAREQEESNEANEPNVEDIRSVGVDISEGKDITVVAISLDSFYHGNENGY
jgi:predicted cupin superfamily sugar epimerase